MKNVRSRFFISLALLSFKYTVIVLIESILPEKVKTRFSERFSKVIPSKSVCKEKIRHSWSFVRSCKKVYNQVEWLHNHLRTLILNCNYRPLLRMNYENIPKRRIIMKSFITFQFGYCLLWCSFHSRSLNNEIKSKTKKLI